MNIYPLNTFKGETKKELEAMVNKIRKEMNKKLEMNIGMLRQWLNEDRITDPNKLVTNEQIMFCLKLKK